jgi:dTDP-4-dehydrorhamnose 3,5-epimerase-like enzyme
MSVDKVLIWTKDLVKVTPRTVHVDDRGRLFEALRTDEDNAEKLKQVYVITDRVAGIIRAYHAHDSLIDYFTIVAGSATFIFWEDAGNGEVLVQKVVADATQPITLTVPAGIFHGWKSLQDGTILLSVASELYNRESPDEHRVSPWSLGPEVWDVEVK